MPTATKIRTKTSKKVVSADETIPEEAELEAIPTKNKKPIEIDEIEPAVVVEEKVEEDPLIGAVEDEEAAEEISLDAEELNPFGDRWEE